MTRITENQYRVMDALRRASAVRRKPGVLTPDGRSWWWSLEELIELDLLADGTSQAVLEAAAQSLYRRGAVHARTQFTVRRFSLTETGAHALETLDREAGMTEHVAAELARDQAHEDIQRAQRDLDRAVVKLVRVHRERPRLTAAEIVHASKEWVRW